MGFLIASPSLAGLSPAPYQGDSGRVPPGAGEAGCVGGKEKRALSCFTPGQASSINHNREQQSLCSVSLSS